MAMPNRLENIDVQLIELFLDVSARMTFNQTAKARGLERSTVKKRIDKLETQLGLSLFNREGSVLRLTPDGELLKSAALQFVEAGRSLAAMVDHIRKVASADIRIDAPEGLAAFWIIPSLIDFRVSYPEVRFIFRHREYNEGSNLENLDFIINYSCEKIGDMESRSLGYQHLLPFASRAYVARFGKPKEPREWRNHLLVCQVASYISPDEMREILGSDVDNHPRAITTTSGTALFHAVQRSGGIGILPSYIAAAADNLVTMPHRTSYRIQMFMHYRPERMADETYALVQKVLREIFDYRRYPWFAPEFLSPEKFAPLPPTDALLIRSLRLAPPFVSTGADEGE